VTSEQIFRLRLLYNISGLIYIIENDRGKVGQAEPDDSVVFQKSTILRYFERISPAGAIPGHLPPGRSTDMAGPKLTAPFLAPNK
jgi:hypothetical protein